MPANTISDAVPFIPRVHQFVSFQGLQCTVRNVRLSGPGGPTALILAPQKPYFRRVPLSSLAPYSDRTASHRAHGWSPYRSEPV